MAYFSASDAWSMQFIGLWPQEKQNQIADWLFSTENDANGQPKGIGLSLWRFNVGAGSTEQGENSQIASPWMRAECFLNPDGTYEFASRILHTERIGYQHRTWRYGEPETGLL